MVTYPNQPPSYLDQLVNDTAAPYLSPPRGKVPPDTVWNIHTPPPKQGASPSPSTPPGKVPATPPTPSGSQVTAPKAPLSAEDIIRQQITRLQQPTFVQKHPWSYLLFLLPGVASGYYRAYGQRQALLGNLMGRLANIQEQNKAYGLRASEDQNQRNRIQGELGNNAIRNALLAQGQSKNARLRQEQIDNQKAYWDAMTKLRNREVTAKASGKSLPPAEQMVMKLVDGYPKLMQYYAIASQQPPDIRTYLSRFNGALPVYDRIMGVTQSPPGTSTDGTPPIPGQLFLPN